MTTLPLRALRRLAMVAVAVALATPAFAGWASLGAMPAPQREKNGLVFKSPQGIVAVSALSPDVVRVRFSPTPEFGRDHSYAVMKAALGEPGAVDVGAAASTLATASLKVTVRHDPFRISFADAAGQSLDEDDPERGMAWAGTQVKVWKRLRDDEFVYGLGEKTGRLNKRGRNLGGYSYAMWNSDTFAYGDDTDPIYVSVPFYMVMRGGRAHGIFFDNTFRSLFDVGHEKQELLSFGAEGGELDYYFINGPTPKQVVERYTELTGRTPLPPRWALGFHQCRYSYFPESKFRDIARNFRERKIPADVLWLDIHYLDGYNPFTWDKERFPDPGKMIADLRKDGFRTVVIVDPHPKKQVGYEPYDTGKAGDHFVKNPDGTDYVAPVWPAAKETKNPGPSVFPDFTKPATRTWWGGLYKKPYLDLGVAGIWNDMNEPAVFIDPAHTMPPHLRHDNEGQPTDHREVHNVYGMLMSKATYDGLLRLRPKERPFILSRASFAGGQRYAALWPGDNTSDWNHLRATIPMFGGMGLSGFSFVGSDIGGFADAPTPELFTRWLQLGVFYPFMRVHTAFGTPDQEPWSYGPRHEEINRRAIELRYELLPHIYNVMQQTSETGLPAFRPLLLDYPDDPATWERDDEFLFGSDLLVAPALREPATEREVYLPKGDWYDFWTNKRYEGGKSMKVPLKLENIPVFVKAGAFVFRQPVVQHTGQMPGQPLIVDVYPAAQSEAILYEDDGETLDYTQGIVSRRAFRQRREGGRTVIEIGNTFGSYRPTPRDLILRVRFDAPPKAVRVGGESLAPTNTGLATPLGRGFSRVPEGVVNVRVADTFEAMQVVIEP